LKVFLCHSSEDKPEIRRLHQRLLADGYQPWLDEVDIIGGSNWEIAIEEAVRESDVVVVSMTPASIAKEGYVQVEIRHILRIAEEKPENVIYVIPLKLDECVVPRMLRQWQYINYFQDDGYTRLTRSLNERARQLGIALLAPAHPTRSAGGERSDAIQSWEDAATAADFVLRRTQVRPTIGIVASSAIDIVGGLTGHISIAHDDIPRYPAHPGGNPGDVSVGVLAGVPVAVIRGRIQLHETSRIEDVVFPIRLLRRMGIESLILTGAAASTRPDFAPGTIVVLSDHINNTGANPLAGMGSAGVGPRFVDLSEVYLPRYREIAIATGRELGFEIREGVYAAHAGPAYETPAEIRQLSGLGADLVGFSIVVDAIAARHMEIQVLAICVVSNLAAGVGAGVLTHDQVLATATRLREQMRALITAVVPRIAG
jgi:purine-nucleoside phosphorylase